MSSQGLGLNISYWQPSLHFYKHLSIFQPDPTRTKIKFKIHNHIQGYLKTKWVDFKINCGVASAGGIII